MVSLAEANGREKIPEALAGEEDPCLPSHCCMGFRLEDGPHVPGLSLPTQTKGWQVFH